MGSAGRTRLRIYEWVFAHAAILAGVCLSSSPMCASRRALARLPTPRLLRVRSRRKVGRSARATYAVTATVAGRMAVEDSKFGVGSSGQERKSSSRPLLVRFASLADISRAHR